MSKSLRIVMLSSVQAVGHAGAPYEGTGAGAAKTSFESKSAAVATDTNLLNMVDGDDRAQGLND